ncbi:MAG: serine/threonine protein kinase [Planctomycetes bacterium]|nr:serine/threonine protein kinase [Planctomycetota bacterium]
MSTRRAQQLFEDWIEALQKVPDLAAESLLNGETLEVRELYLQIVDDYRALQLGRPSSHAVFAGPAGHGEVAGYRLVREIGRGGMGVVWEAVDEGMGAPTSANSATESTLGAVNKSQPRPLQVAIKMLHPFLGISGTSWQRFEREAELAQRLDHAAIVKVLGVGEAEGTPYIVQELVAGGRTLADRIREEDPDEALPSGHFAALATMFATLADALQNAHDHGVVHRDLKPGNILLDGEQVKVADFGLAFASDLPGLSRTGDVLGTPAYMSPEQLAGSAVEAASDIFSLGATLYEALTLHRAFPGDTREQIVQNIRLHEPIAPRMHRSRVPRELALICLKALRKKPADRYASMADFGADLNRYVNGRSVQARPAGTWMRASLWMRRHPSASAGLVVAGVAMVLLAALAIYAQTGWRRAEEEASIAVARQQTAERIEAFFAGLFSRMGPSGETNLQTPALELLEMAEQELEASAGDKQSQLVNEPAVRAGLWMALGSLHAGLGHNERAERYLTRALKMHQQYIGPMDQRTLKAHNQLAQLLVGRAKFEEAEQHYLAAQRGHDELYGAESPKALENQGNLAFLYWRQKRLEEAEPLLRNSLRGTMAEWGDDHFHTWSARSNLAAFLVANQKPAEAVPMLRAVVARRTASEGEHSPATISARSLLAAAIKDLDQLEEAEAIYRSILASCKITYADDHQTPSAAKHNLGILLAETDRLEEAEDLLLQAWQTRRSKLREGHPDTANTLRNLKHVWQKLGLDPDAELATKLNTQSD